MEKLSTRRRGLTRPTSTGPVAVFGMRQQSQPSAVRSIITHDDEHSYSGRLYPLHTVNLVLGSLLPDPTVRSQDLCNVVCREDQLKTTSVRDLTSRDILNHSATWTNPATAHPETLVFKSMGNWR